MLIGIVVAVVVAAGLIYAFLPQPVPVDLAVLARGPLTVTVDEEGETRVEDVYVVSAPVAGRLLRIEGEVGDLVIAGETVVASLQEAQPAFLNLRARRQAEAEVRAAEAALTLAQAEVERAEAELEFARNDLARSEALARRETISERTLDRSRLDVKTGSAALARARAELRVSESQLETARAALIEPGIDPVTGEREGCCVTLRAPVSGRILRILDESERVVEAGTPLLEIGDPYELEVVVDVLSQDAVRVEPGAEVLIEDWGGGDALRGRVSRVEPYGFTKVSALGIEEQRVNVIVAFADPAAARRALGHGYRVMARIIVWQDDDVLVLPIGALFRRGDTWAVYVDEDGRARERAVAIGRRNSRHAEVLDGLRQGEAVVLYPSDRVGEDVRIVARGALDD
jgi:HlyD family secretion protein